MNKIYRYLRAIIAITVATAAILAFAGIFYPLKIFDMQLTALLQRSLIDFSLTAGILLLTLFLITFLFGRVYCSTLCPLGLFQEFLTLLFRRKTKMQKNRPYKYFLAAAVFGALIGGTVYLVRLIDPYSLFGSAASGAYLGLAVLFLLTILVWFKGRCFCIFHCGIADVASA